MIVICPNHADVAGADQINRKADSRPNIVAVSQNRSKAFTKVKLLRLRDDVNLLDEWRVGRM